jgi:transcriptional regulator with XRE-family HTH domain
MVSDATRLGTHSGSRSELADLLRSRRDRLTPADVGLPAGTRRRTAGLRREEVAQLAGVSTTYYTFLEQGRDVRPSRQVVTALASALRLSSAERAHLFQLAGISVAAEDQAQAETVAPVVSALVGRLDPFPAYLKGRRWDVLAANRTARALFTDWCARDPGDRNQIWWMFTDPEARKVYVHWEKEAADMLGRFRAAAGRRPAGGHAMTWPRSVAGRSACTTRLWAMWPSSTPCCRSPTIRSRCWSTSPPTRSRRPSSPPWPPRSARSGGYPARSGS